MGGRSQVLGRLHYGLCCLSFSGEEGGGVDHRCWDDCTMVFAV